MNYRTYTITCTYSYYGYPQAEDHYTIETDCLKIKIVHYGNNGFDIPKEIGCNRRCNGFYWDLHPLMEALYGRKLKLYDLKEGKKIRVKLDIYGNVVNE